MLEFIPVPIKISRRRYQLYFMNFENGYKPFVTQLFINKRLARRMIERIKYSDSYDDQHVKDLLLECISENHYNSLRNNINSHTIISHLHQSQDTSLMTQLLF